MHALVIVCYKALEIEWITGRSKQCQASGEHIQSITAAVAVAVYDTRPGTG